MLPSTGIVEVKEWEWNANRDKILTVIDHLVKRSILK